MNVIVLGQPAPAACGLSVAWAQLGPSRHTLHDARGRDETIRHLLTTGYKPDVAVLVVPAETGVRFDVRTQLRLALLRGVERFILFLERSSATLEPVWVDLVEVDAREILTGLGVPADDLPLVDSIEALRDAVEATVPSEQPLHMTIREVLSGLNFAQSWTAVVDVVSGVCHRGSRLRLIGLDNDGDVTVGAMWRLFETLDTVHAPATIELL